MRVHSVIIVITVRLVLTRALSAFAVSPTRRTQ